MDVEEQCTIEQVDAGVIEHSKPKNLLKVLKWMSLAILSFTAMAVSIREATQSLSVFEATSIRHAVGLVFLVLLALAHPGLRRPVPVATLPLHLLRNSIQFGGQTAWNLAMVSLPLATAFALEFATPLLTVVLAVLLLHERLTPSRRTAIGVGAVGILVIVLPQSQDLGWPMLLPLGAALSFALSDIITKRLTTKQSTVSIMLCMCAMQLPMNLAASEWRFWERIDQTAILPLAVLSISGFLGHFALTRALSYGDATLVVPLDFLRLPLAMTIGLLAYGEVPAPALILGAGILLGAVLVNVLGERTSRTR